MACCSMGGLRGKVDCVLFFVSLEMSKTVVELFYDVLSPYSWLAFSVRASMSYYRSRVC